jgi:hypothetical protein
MTDTSSARFSLAEQYKLFDSIPTSPEEKWMWLPKGFVERFRRVGRDWDRAEALGYESAQTYRRDLAALGAIHGPRLSRRLAQLVPAHRRRP